MNSTRAVPYWLAALAHHERRMLAEGTFGARAAAFAVARYIADAVPAAQDPTVVLTARFVRGMMVSLHITPAGLRELLCHLVEHEFLTWEQPDSLLFYLDPHESSWGTVRPILPEWADNLSFDPASGDRE